MTTRRELLWDIQKELHRLISASRTDLLYRLAVSCEAEATEDLPEGGATEIEIFDFIVDFLKGEQLKHLEDQGMARLRDFRNLIDRLQALAPDPVNRSGSTGSVMDGQTEPAPVGVEQVSGLIRLEDVAAFLPRREFKIHGGQIADSDSELSYSSVCKQMDEGVTQKYSESEIIRTVLKVIKPGTFKDMLNTKEDLTLAEFKRFLRAHLRDKSSAELFQELSNAKQHEKETPQQFVYRMMGLKQRVMSASQQHGSEFKYDHNLVQGVFIHSLYQGFNEKCTYVRRDIRPYISDTNIADDAILEQITHSANEEAERQNRLGPTHRPKLAAVNVKHDSDHPHATQVTGEVQANRTAIHELTAQVSALARSLEKVMRPGEGGALQNTRTAPPTTTQPDKPETRGKCRQCATQGNGICTHCFRCGQAGHRAVGCMMKSTQSGNEVRPLERDHQWPRNSNSPQSQ